VRTPGNEDDPTLFLMDFCDIDRRLLVIESTDPNLDIATPPLGYCQVTRDRVVYITRKPWRKWKQGIIWDALFIEDITDGSQHYHFYTEAMRNTLSTNYMPLGLTATQIREAAYNYMELAVNNDVCLVVDDKQVFVYFRNERVGFTKREGFGIGKPVIVVPTTRKAWVVNRYLSAFGFDIIIK